MLERVVIAKPTLKPVFEEMSGSTTSAAAATKQHLCLVLSYKIENDLIIDIKLMNRNKKKKGKEKGRLSLKLHGHLSIFFFLCIFFF
jgi:hypothetical protein